MGRTQHALSHPLGRKSQIQDSLNYLKKRGKKRIKNRGKEEERKEKKKKQERRRDGQRGSAMLKGKVRGGEAIRGEGRHRRDRGKDSKNKKGRSVTF